MRLLSQTALVAATPTDILTNPKFSPEIWLVKYIYVTVVGSYGSESFRLSLAPGGIATANDQYIYYNRDVAATGFQSDQMLALQPGDILRAYGSAAITISLFGEKIPI